MVCSRRCENAVKRTLLILIYCDKRSTRRYDTPVSWSMSRLASRMVCVTSDMHPGRYILISLQCCKATTSNNSHISVRACLLFDRSDTITHHNCCALRIYFFSPSSPKSMRLTTETVPIRECYLDAATSLLYAKDPNSRRWRHPRTRLEKQTEDKTEYGYTFEKRKTLSIASIQSHPPGT